MKPQHLHTGNNRKSVDKLGKKRAPLGNVAAVARQVLSYDIELMVGFPGEDEAAFGRLLDFVREQRFERMGAFAYCEEEGTYGLDRS